jgi:hypothetical protein
MDWKAVKDLFVSDCLYREENAARKNDTEYYWFEFTWAVVETEIIKEEEYVETVDFLIKEGYLEAHETSPHYLVRFTDQAYRKWGHEVALKVLQRGVVK